MIAASRPRVLVVEDDREMNALERELLEASGFDSVPAYDGAEAVNRCPDCDAVLLDLMLPEMDGFEACRRMRRRRDGQLPIVILTALDNEDCRRRGMESGADAYFCKPFDPDEVTDALRRLIDEEPVGAE